jgi:hypothetical protein
MEPALKIRTVSFLRKLGDPVFLDAAANGKLR